MLTFQFAELAENSVVFLVADDRIVFDVVAVVVDLDFFLQFGYSSGNLVDIRIHNSNIAENQPRPIGISRSVQARFVPGVGAASPVSYLNKSEDDAAYLPAVAFFSTSRQTRRRLPPQILSMSFSE